MNLTEQLRAFMRLSEGTGCWSSVTNILDFEGDLEFMLGQYGEEKTKEMIIENLKELAIEATYWSQQVKELNVGPTTNNTR